ncbi:MAG TPA: DnaA/Hda family protein [Burkholderiales bacterium]|nr:DnaA/Hda family protein [Burkholderiales bacterium]
MKQLVLALSATPAPSLDNFVVGRNGTALAALRALINQTQMERVVYLYGERGCGKTHLLRATGDALPALIADDVHHLDAPQQIALFNAFNDARTQGLPILIAGDTAPLELKVREDLRTRIGSGLVFQLHALSDVEKREALRAHAQQRGLRLGDDVLNYVLTHLRRDMPTQMLVLDAIDQYSLVAKRPVTLPLVRQALESLEK